MKDKKIRKYMILIALLFLGLIFVEMNRKEPLNWEPTFINTDKNPYGTYICYDLLKDVFPESQIWESRYAITNELEYVDENENSYYERSSQNPLFENTSYVFINRNFDSNNGLYGAPSASGIDKLDVKNLLKFVEEGNNAFIAAEKMSNILLDTLKLKIETEWSSPDSIYIFNDLRAKEFAFRGVRRGQHYIVPKDSCALEMRTLVQSKNYGRAIFVKIRHGKGYIYLHSMPIAFSNIELLKLHKYDFAFACLSYLPKSNNIIWDEYLKQGRVGEYSSFRVIWNHPALLFVYFILLFGGIIFMLFRAKRTQRIIPVVEPPKNSSVEFLNTISNLYYKKQSYASIVEKRHNYFLEMVRSKYYLSTEKTDEEFFKNLSLKSGVNISIIEDVFASREYIKHQYNVSNSALLRYNSKLEEFYREMK